MNCLVMMLGDLQDRVPLLRIHSQCLTGEVLGSLRCDCRGQLELAMSTIAEQDSVSHLLTPGGPWHRADGEAKGYALQDQGLDTRANEALGFDADCRDFIWPWLSSVNLRSRQVR